MVMPATEQYAPVPVKVRPGLTTSAVQRPSRLLKNVLERSGCAKLIQHSGLWRTKDSAPRGPGSENCASLIPSRVFQQPARDSKSLSASEPSVQARHVLTRAWLQRPDPVTSARHGLGH